MCVFCVLRSLGLGDRGLNTGPVLEEFRDLSGFIQSVLSCRRGVSPPAAPSLCCRDVQRAWVAGARAQVLKLFFLCVSCSQLNLSRPIEEQGPLDVIIHKLTDVILEADQNDSQSLELVHRFQVSRETAQALGLSRRACAPEPRLWHRQGLGCGQALPAGASSR